jgi:phosphate transport system permease protein
VIDILFGLITFIGTVLVLGVLALILFQLLILSWPVIEREWFSNIFSSVWYTDDYAFGMLPFILGTLVTSILAIIIATPVGIGVALFINEYVPIKIKKTLTFIIELIAAIPSVIIGLWGIIHFAPWVNLTIAPLLYNLPLPLFNSPESVRYSNVFSAVLILTIMILPIIISITRGMFEQVPIVQKEAAYALGATSWEMSRMSLLPQARRGIIGAVILAYGRAVGETMAVTMVIGNNNAIFGSIFESGATLTSVITTEFSEAISDPLKGAAIMQLGLILLAFSLIVNVIARLIIGKGTGTGRMEG